MEISEAWEFLGWFFAEFRDLGSPWPSLFQKFCTSGQKSRQISTRPHLRPYLFTNFLRNFQKPHFSRFCPNFVNSSPIWYPICLCFFVKFSKSPKISSKFPNRPPEKPYRIINFWEIFENCPNFPSFRIFLKFLLKFCYRP